MAVDRSVFEGLKVSLADRYRRDVEIVDAFQALMLRLEAAQDTGLPEAPPGVPERGVPGLYEPTPPQPISPEALRSPQSADAAEPVRDTDMPDTGVPDTGVPDTGVPDTEVHFCSGCGHDRPVGDFDVERRYKEDQGTRSYWCRVCSGTSDEDRKRCRQCFEMLPKDSFVKAKDCIGGLRPRCRECERKSRKPVAKKPTSGKPTSDEQPRGEDRRRCKNGTRCISYSEDYEAALLPNTEENVYCEPCRKRAGIA